jgi:hypothetical protein
MKGNVSIRPRVVVLIACMGLLLLVFTNSSAGVQDVRQKFFGQPAPVRLAGKAIDEQTRWSRPEEYSVPAPPPQFEDVPEYIPEYVPENIPSEQEVVEETTPEIEKPAAVGELRKYYHSDFQSEFNLTYLEFSIDTPEVKEMLDKHDVKTDFRYKVADVGLYEAWGNVIAKGPRENDKRIYVANAGGKGWGVYSDVHINKGDLVDVYTGLRTTDGSNTKYQWNYQSKPLDPVSGEKTYIGTDSLVYGNWMRFINGTRQPN